MLTPVAGAPDLSDMERMAAEVLRNLPAPFLDFVGDVVLCVEEFADAAVLADMGIDDPWDLTGLYHGIPLDEQSVWDSGDMPPFVTLFRSPLLAEWHETGVELSALIRHVVVHEIGHHFGLSDQDMHDIEDGAG